MPIIVAAKGMVISLSTTITYPIGVTLTNFTDDIDPVDYEQNKIADTAKEVNGKLVMWSIANPNIVRIGALPGTPEAAILNILYIANKPTPYGFNLTDVVNMTILFPDLQSTTLTNGFLTAGPPGPGVATQQRKKSLVYEFSFEDGNNII